MANNVTLPATGSGSATPVVATEDIAGVQFQAVKLVDGTVGSTTPIPLVATLENGLDVDVTRSALPSGAATEASLAKLTITQGDAGGSLQGPMIQGLVSDSPESFISGDVHPLLLTSEGRLRVSAVNSDINQVWQNTWDNPWAAENGWGENNVWQT